MVYAERLMASSLAAPCPCLPAGCIARGGGESGAVDRLTDRWTGRRQARDRVRKIASPPQNGQAPGLGSSSVGRDMLDQDMGPLWTLRGCFYVNYTAGRGGFGWKDHPENKTPARGGWVLFHLPSARAGSVSHLPGFRAPARHGGGRVLT